MKKSRSRSSSCWLITRNGLSPWWRRTLIFSKNYVISKANESEKWFFPYSGDTYLLSVTNTFPAEDFYIKIQDTKGIYKEQIIQLQAFNMYILCSSENERQAKSFGPRTNRPIEVILEKE